MNRSLLRLISSMPKLPAVRPREVARFLQHRGFVLDHSSGSHFIYYNPTAKRGAVIPQHNRDIPKRAPLAFAGSGVTREEFLQFLLNK
jgi:predicted RNA binding protein YcfA (HicA-like mRNA interferase family)